MSRAALAFGVIALLIACGGGPTPTPTPGGFGDVIAQLVLRDVTVHGHVSGDDGCDRVDLHDNAARLSVSHGLDPSRYEVYIFRWRRESDFVAAAAPFFMCLGDFRSQNPGSGLSVVEESPWRAYGAAWPETLEQAIGEAIRAASG